MQSNVLGNVRIRIRYAVLLLYCCIGVVSARAQLGVIKGSPCEATKTRTVNLPDDSFSVSGRVARSSNGSTYEEMPNHKTGEIDLIQIFDAPGQRSITLDVRRKLYWVQPQSLSIGTLSSAEALQKHIEFLRTWKGDHTSDNGVETERIPLGFRTEDGFLEFGVRRVIDHMPSSWTLKEKVWEDWDIPTLAIPVEKVGFDSNNKPDQIIKYSNIRTTEPDPHLFEIPRGYSPGPDRASK
jgi:hypothetical protein